MVKPKLVVFASGTKEGGGTGFENLVRHTQKYAEQTQNFAEKILDYEVAGVVSNHEHGGVRERAERLGIPFIYFGGETHSNVLKNIRMRYREIVEKSGADWVALSGWLLHVSGLDPAKTFNIHPAILSQLGGRFGGKSMYGLRIHEAVREAFEKGQISESGLTMHFVTDEYDKGHVFFEYRVPLEKGMTAEEIAKAVNIEEHRWQPKIANMVVHGEISWDGVHPGSLKVPEGYEYLPRNA